MTDSQLSGTNLLTCPFSIPDPKASAPELLSRWSNTFVDSPPAVIITPNTEEDVVSAVSFARLNSLTIVPTGGRHGSAIPIHSKILYLDLQNLKAIELDKQNAQVHFGGGTLTGDLLRHLSQEGYFTSIVNSNAVGVVGSFLGGGNTSVNGLVGWMADNIVSLRLVTASGDIVQLSPSSTGEELALFNVLCGAGHGLGVVVSATMRVFSLSSLNLSPASKEDPTPSIWNRTMIFPPTAIDSAVDAFLAFVPPPAPMNIVFGFSRGPPGTPLAGKPIIMLQGTYYGSASEAEASPAGASLLHPSLAAKAIMANTIQIPFHNVNNAIDPLNAHGGFKSMSSARIATLSPPTLKSTFAKYIAVTDKYPDSGRTALMFHSFNPFKLTELGATPEGADKFVEVRDRGFCTVGVSWSFEVATREALAAFFDDAVVTLQKDDEEAGLAPRVFPGIMKFLPGRRDLLPEEKLAELDRVHAKWNRDELFWNPYKAS
ncbi:6-hydroxy-d-nicotine oxidase [Trichoderma arundinaceum]|uniref:6-hydroxy-d-nicotine oxidase n=1 Tax=Trichoderma arundinaceum TaxID=490622 RepID=A0A395NT77_TRIAR|nr:6-hydroxy-d-nicotine oxidase [Trichoderma arundinaceum]